MTSQNRRQCCERWGIFTPTRCDRTPAPRRDRSRGSRVSKSHKRRDRRGPPRFRRLAAGQVWRVQRRDASSVVTHPVLSAEIDEVTPGTVLVRWQSDGSIQVRADALVMRIARDEFRFIERVPV